MMATSSSRSRSTRAASPGAPVTVMTLPRAWMRASNDDSMRRRNSSAGPKRATASTLAGTVKVCGTRSSVIENRFYRSAGWPAHGATGQDVRVAVEHRLVRLRTGVEHQPVLAADIVGDAPGQPEKVDGGLWLGRCQAPDVGLVHPRNDQYVRGRLRVDV